MILAAVGAALAGAIIGVLALPWSAYFIKELTLGRVRTFAATAASTLLVGSAIASSPVGSWVFKETLVPWFIIGEAVTSCRPRCLLHTDTRYFQER